MGNQSYLDNFERDEDNKRKRVDITCTDEEKYYGEDEEDDYRSQDTVEQERHRDDKDLAVRRPKLLQIFIKVEGKKNSTSSLVAKNLRKQAHPAQPSMKANAESQRKSPGVIDDDDDDDDDNHDEDSGPKEPSKSFLKSKAGPSNSVPEKPCERSCPALPVKKNKTLLINVKVEDATSNLVSERSPPPKAKTQQGMKYREVIYIDDDNEELSGPSGPCGNQADQLGPKDKGKSVVSEVEILDSKLFTKQGITSPFVPSTKFHGSLFDDEDVEGLAFREDVLKVLRKPFDLDEYNRLKEEFRSYDGHYKDLKKRLQARCKSEKRLAILRGFFFWLQNLTREGAFEPWNDRACLELEVEPPHVCDDV